MNSNTTIAVIGAGIVGCSCALWLQRKGFSVILIDPDDPGAGTSSGNACTIADYGCVPVNSPSLFKRMPSLLTSSESPLSLNFHYALTHPAWMLQFLANCREHKVARIVRLLGKLLAKTYDGLDPLLDMAEARDLMQQRGCMYVYRNEQDFRDASPSNQARRAQGVEYTELDRADIDDAILDKIEGIAYERLKRWLTWVDEAEPTLVADRPAIAARDEQVRKNICLRDPANALADKMFGKENAAEMVATLWGGNRTLARPSGE